MSARDKRAAVGTTFGLLALALLARDIYELYRIPR